MAEYIRPFDVQADTVNQAVTGSSQVLAINSTAIGVRTALVTNIGTQTIFVKFTTSAGSVSATTGVPILANTAQTFLIRPEQTHVAHIASTTGSSIYVTVGEGA